MTSCISWDSMAHNYKRDSLNGHVSMQIPRFKLKVSTPGRGLSSTHLKNANKSIQEDPIEMRHLKRESPLSQVKTGKTKHLIPKKISCSHTHKGNGVVGSADAPPDHLFTFLFPFWVVVNNAYTQQHTLQYWRQDNLPALMWTFMPIFQFRLILLRPLPSFKEHIAQFPYSLFIRSRKLYSQIITTCVSWDSMAHNFKRDSLNGHVTKQDSPFWIDSWYLPSCYGRRGHFFSSKNLLL